VAAPQNILFVIDSFRDPQAGTEGQLFKLIQGLDRKAYRPHLLVFEETPYLQQYEFPCPYGVLGKRSLTNPLMWYRLYRFAKKSRKNGVRLAHIFFNDASIICPPVFAWVGIKTIISRRDMGYWYTPTYLRLLRITRRWVSCVVVNSRAVKEVTVEKEGIHSDLVQVIYNGYENNTSIPIQPLSELEQLRLSPNTLIVGLVANIRPIKRIKDAIDALAMLGDDYKFGRYWCRG
jgi:glycosyltransferase involved in cell wall biosynthesis